MGQKDNSGTDGNFCMMTGKKQKLEDMVAFPTDYRFKVMGKTGVLEIELVVQTMETICGATIDRDAIEVRESSGGTYTSYTVPVWLEEAAHLTAIYDMLSKHDHIKYYL